MSIYFNIIRKCKKIKLAKTFFGVPNKMLRICDTIQVGGGTMNKVERETIDAWIDDIKVVLQEKNEFLSVVEMVNVLNSLKHDIETI